MLPEISLNILDISQNSISAKATQIKIMVWVNTFKQQIKVQIKDNGTGMDAETVKRVTDPFYTTRTTRKVGLGIPFFKQEAECTGGSFSISSVLGQGTDIQAIFCTLIVMHPDIEFYYGYQVNEAEFHLDTKEMREMLGDIPLDTPEISSFIRDYLEENESDINRMQNYPG